MEWVKARAKEQSTWRGFGLLLVAAGLLPVGAVDLVVSAGLAIVGIVETLRSEKK